LNSPPTHNLELDEEEILQTAQWLGFCARIPIEKKDDVEWFMNRLLGQWSELVKKLKGCLKFLDETSQINWQTNKDNLRVFLWALLLSIASYWWNMVGYRMLIEQKEAIPQIMNLIRGIKSKKEILRLRKLKINGCEDGIFLATLSSIIVILDAKKILDLYELKENKAQKEFLSLIHFFNDAEIENAMKVLTTAIELLIRDLDFGLLYTRTLYIGSLLLLQEFKMEFDQTQNKTYRLEGIYDRNEVVRAIRCILTELNELLKQEDFFNRPELRSVKLHIISRIERTIKQLDLGNIDIVKALFIFLTKICMAYYFSVAGLIKPSIGFFWKPSPITSERRINQLAKIQSLPNLLDNLRINFQDAVGNYDEEFRYIEMVGDMRLKQSVRKTERRRLTQSVLVDLFLTRTLNPKDLYRILVQDGLLTIDRIRVELERVRAAYKRLIKRLETIRSVDDLKLLLSSYGCPEGVKSVSDFYEVPTTRIGLWLVFILTRASYELTVISENDQDLLLTLLIVPISEVDETVDYCLRKLSLYGPEHLAIGLSATIELLREVDRNLDRYFRHMIISYLIMMLEELRSLKVRRPPEPEPSQYLDFLKLAVYATHPQSNPNLVDKYMRLIDMTKKFQNRSEPEQEMSETIQSARSLAAEILRSEETHGEVAN
jgi:hypothetical protein